MSYTAERNTQMLIYMLKKYGIRKVIASPGTTNVAFVGSIQSDPFFEVYSSVDERSAAYIACGMSVESGEPVVLSCTGATASRNYLPGLTEAFYRNIPIIAVTSTQPINRIGHLIPQVIDRTTTLNDVVKKSVQLQAVKDSDDEWNCQIKLNHAFIEMVNEGRGPIHINLETTYNQDFSHTDIKPITVIDRYFYGAKFPFIKAKEVAIFVGAHNMWSEQLTHLVEDFCEKFNGAVICEQISNYKGKYAVYPSIVNYQSNYVSKYTKPSLMIHIGSVSAYPVVMYPLEVWRVSPDGNISDTYRKLTKVFKMTETEFFQEYCKDDLNTKKTELTYFYNFNNETLSIKNRCPELPFSNVWIANNTISRLPDNCVLHLGILNSVRTWSMFTEKVDFPVYSNTGGFGIDGLVSSLLGASLCDPNKLYFGVVGDLAMFYDLNALGNRHFSPNIRLMVINNGKGTEFRNFNHPANRFGDEADRFMAAAGHFGNKSPSLLKDICKNLGIYYLSATDKREFLERIPEFVSKKSKGKAFIFEIFTDSTDESKAIELSYSIVHTKKSVAKNVLKGVLGDSGIEMVKKIIK